jgi:nitrite reductase/ring-hydroxylating ferredoxin subunit
MPDLVNLGKASEVPPGTMKGFVVKGTKVLVANLEGKFYSINSVCTHLGGPLDRGTLVGGVVTCPWHGSKFDVANGIVVSGPASKSEQTHKVVQDGEDLLLEF